LTHALRALGKPVTPVSVDGVPEIYRWLPGADLIQTSAEGTFDLAIVCDAATPERTGSSARVIRAARDTLVIDHHVSESDFGRVRLVEPRAAATGEIVYSLLRHMRVPFSRDIAECLLCAIVTDTGSFRFMNVTAATFRVAAALMRYGACPGCISELVFETRSMASLKLLGRALDALQVTPDGRVSWSVLTMKDFHEVGATDEDTEGIVTHVRAVRGTDVGVLLRELPEGGVKVSLRSRRDTDVSAIAERFGGGGHVSAAGCTIEAPLETAVAQVLEALHNAV
jgi:phosphoesterase RecJ-like protein